MLTFESKKAYLPNFKEVLEELGYKLVNYGNNQFRTRAIYRNGKTPTSVVVSPYNYYDFGNPDDDQKYGSIFKLIALTTGLSEEEVYKKYAGVSIDSKTTENIVKQPSYFVIEEDHPRIYNEELLNKLIKNYEYFSKRGISVSTQKIFEAGLAVKNMFSGRIVFPIRNIDDKIIGVAGRLIYDNPSLPKWKIKGYKRDFIYNYRIAHPHIKENNYVVLVESIGDLLSLYESGIKNALCLFGLDLSNALIKYLISVDVNIVISTNNDEGKEGTPGIVAALKRKKQLVNYFNSDRIMTLLPNKVNDWNDYLLKFGPEELRKYIYENLCQKINIKK